MQGYQGGKNSQGDSSFGSAKNSNEFGVRGSSCDNSSHRPSIDIYRGVHTPKPNGMEIMKRDVKTSIQRLKMPENKIGLYGRTPLSVPAAMNKEAPMSKVAPRRRIGKAGASIISLGSSESGSNVAD